MEEAVEATKLGAFNFLEKPIDPKRLQVELRNCLERSEKERQLEVAHRRLRDLGVLGKPRGAVEEDAGSDVAGRASRAFARFGVDHRGKRHRQGTRGATIHELSPRARRALRGRQLRRHPRDPDGERDLRAREGRLHRGRRAPPGLLRAGRRRHAAARRNRRDARRARRPSCCASWKTRKVRRLGSKSEISVDVRVLAATNKVPEDAVAKGELRNDLYFRLNVVRIHHARPCASTWTTSPTWCRRLLEDLNRKHNRAVKWHGDELLGVLPTLLVAG